MDHCPPLNEQKIWSKCASTPPKNSSLLNNYFSFVLQPPPLAGPSHQVQRVQAGLGLGLGVQGQVQAELWLGVRELWEDFLTTHRSHCSKTLFLATAPQPPPLELITFQTKALSLQKTIIRGRCYTFCMVRVCCVCVCVCVCMCVCVCFECVCVFEC